VKAKRSINWKKFATILLVILAVYCLLAVMPRPQSVKENPFVIKEGSRPLLIAHGGGNREFPDNTLEACYNAYHADPNVMLEMDVSITKDNVVIMSHDTTLDYRTSASGAIADWNYTDLLAEKGIKTDIDVDSIEDQQNTGAVSSDTKTATGAIADIRTAVINGDSCYYIRLDGANVYYAVYASDFETVVIANKGDNVEITYKESTETIIEAESFKLK